MSYRFRWDRHQRRRAPRPQRRRRATPDSAVFAYDVATRGEKLTDDELVHHLERVVADL